MSSGDQRRGAGSWDAATTPRPHAPVPLILHGEHTAVSMLLSTMVVDGESGRGSEGTAPVNEAHFFTQGAAPAKQPPG